MKKGILLVLCLLMVLGSFAQSSKAKPKAKAESGFKIGYIFEDYIFENYHELKRLDTLVQMRKKLAQDNYNNLAISYQTKYLAYQKSLTNLDSVTTETLNVKLKEVQSLKSEAEEFQKNAERDLQLFINESVQKVKVDIAEAAKVVAKAKNYPWVLYRNANESLMQGNKMVLYYNDKGAHNLSDAVLVSLGSKVPAKK